MARAGGALSLEEEKHGLLAKAHLALAAKCRAASVEATRRAVDEALHNFCEAQKDLQISLRSASREVLADRATMLVVLPVDGEALELCSQELQQDPEVVLAACQDWGLGLESASLELRADRDFVLQAVRVHGGALEHVQRDDFRGDREIVLTAMQSWPFALQFARDDLLQDRSLVLAALQRLTRRQVLTEEPFLLSNFFRSDAARSDKELVLEAALVDGQALHSASAELRRDKDFVLEFMRRAPEEDQLYCPDQADESVKSAISLEDFQGACNSVLASAGTQAPVLTITPCLPDAGPDPEHPSLLSWEVSLLSGASFTCRTELRLTVGQLAERVHGELLVQTEAVPPPARIFIVFNKRDGEGGDLSIPVTPWDWNRPVMAFCQPPELVKAELVTQMEVDPPPARIFSVVVKHDAEGEYDGEDFSTPATPWDWSRPVADFC